MVGDLMVDRFLHGDCSRISPEAPVPVVHVEEEMLRLGGAANVAHNIAALGGEPLLFGVVGDDEAGRSFPALLEEAGIASQGVLVVSDRPTTVKTRIVARGQQMVRVDWERSLPLGGEDGEALLRRIAGAVEGCSALVVSDYAKGVVTPELFSGMARLCRRLDLPLLLDPKPSQSSIYGAVDLMTPNLPEAEAITGRTGDEAGIPTLLEILKERFRCGLGVVITMGPRGMAYLHSESGRVNVVPTAAREVYDVTGAGDTAMAALALGLASGLDLEGAVELANAAAAVVVGKQGTAQASPEEVVEVLRSLGDRHEQPP